MPEIESKIISLEKFLPVRRKIREDGKKLVFTNGCFDIIHRGHIEYLQKAKKLGDYLIIGMNSDRSVRKIKGTNRPIIEEEDRAIVLGAIQVVDFVSIFDEPTPLKLIEAIQPDVLVKGADWNEDEIVGADFVKAHGGSVERIELVEGKGTSGIIDRIIRLYGGKTDGTT